MQDPYRVLGVARTASQKEIKSAYRKLARAYHPDVSLRPEANREFAAITEAYRILGDANLRSRYDRGETLREDFILWRARHMASEARINKLVEEEINRYRQEVRSRGQTVAVITTLFISTFIFSVMQPVLILGLYGYCVLTLLSLCGVAYMVNSLRTSLDIYTYRPQIPSITNIYELPDKPFSRPAAIAFLVLGYTVSLALGSFLGKLVEDSYWMIFERGSIIGIFLFPPIAVLIIGSMRQINDRI